MLVDYLHEDSCGSAMLMSQYLVAMAYMRVAQIGSTKARHQMYLIGYAFHRDGDSRFCIRLHS